MKILILKAQPICHGILDTIADNFGCALQEKGFEIVYFDIKKEPAENIGKFWSQSFLAVIDIYSGLLAANMGDEYYWDAFNIPIFQLCLDYPLYIDSILGVHLKKYYPLCMDRYYLDAFREFYQINTSFFFPICGKCAQRINTWKERSQDIVFIGAFENYREYLALLNNSHLELRDFEEQYFEMLIENPQWNQMQAFEVLCKENKLEFSREEKKNLFMKIGKLARAAMFYHREKMIEELVKNNIEVHVYGSSWNNSPLTMYPTLKLHDTIQEDAYVSVMSDAKISLNLLYSNKAGYTERFAYSMLNGAISVTDESEYLIENFVHEKDIMFYQLNRPVSILENVQWIFSHTKEASEISNRAREKAVNLYQWEHGANRFLEILLQVLEQS